MRMKILIGLVAALLAGCWVASGQQFVGRPLMPLNAGGWTSDCGTVPVTRGLVQWLCGATLNALGYTNGASVTNWADVGPLGINHMYRTNTFGSMTAPIFSELTGSVQPYYVQFGDLTTGAAMANSNAWYDALPSAEFVMVGKRQFSASDMGWMTMGRSGQDNFWYSGGTPNTFSDFGSSTRKNVGNLNFKSTNVFRVNIVTTNANWELWTNGVLAFSTNVNTVAWPTNVTRALYGYSLPSGVQSGLQIFEVLAFTNILTVSERAAVDAWLDTKYP